MRGREDREGGGGVRGVSLAVCCRPGSLVAAREWLLQLPTRGLEPVDCGSQSLDQPQISAIEKAVLGMKKVSLDLCVCSMLAGLPVFPFSTTLH